MPTGQKGGFVFMQGGSPIPWEGVLGPEGCMCSSEVLAGSGEQPTGVSSFVLSQTCKGSDGAALEIQVTKDIDWKMEEAQLEE